MKKIFALVLSLVMALSLTTVAFGADVTVTYDDTLTATQNGKALYDAVMAAADGDTINVGAGTYYLTDGETSRFSLSNKSVTIVGAGVGQTILQGQKYGVVLQDHINPDSTTTFTLKNMTIESLGTGAAVYAKYNITVNLENVNLVNAGSTAILLDNCNKYADGQFHAGTGTVLNATNVTIEDGDKVELNANPCVAYPDAEPTTAAVNIGSGNNFDASDCQPQNVSLGADNLSVNGTYINYDSSDADTLYNNLYLKGTDKGDVITVAPINLSFHEANAAVYNTDGTLKTEGNIAYYTTDGVAFAGKYVAVSTLAEADVVVYKDAAGKNVYMYLDEVDMVKYVGNGTPYADFGAKCGQIATTSPYYSKTATYYTWGDILYRVAKATETGDRGVMVNGKVVEVVTCDTLANLITKHVALCTYVDGVITAIECKECGMDAVKAANYMSIPKGAQNVYDNVAQTYWYFPSAAAGTVVVPSTDKVQSAETFDAGIAMYVGMSVLAATGSAVVIGKKRED